jgi:putative ABC transport system ATP-binding protein
MTDPILNATGLQKRYGDKVTAVDEFSLTLMSGEFVALHGPSGCGKSTLLLLLGGLTRPDRGTVQLKGTDFSSLRPDARARHRADHLGFVFQDANLIPYGTVLDNVVIPLLAKSRADAHERAASLLEELGLSDRLTHKPRELSAGEQQRVALARALIHKPALLLADEPTGNLDAENAEVVLETFRKHAAGGGAVLMVTHDEKARQSAGRAIEMRDGKPCA